MVCSRDLLGFSDVCYCLGCRAFCRAMLVTVSTSSHPRKLYKEKVTEHFFLGLRTTYYLESFLMSCFFFALFSCCLFSSFSFCCLLASCCLLRKLSMQKTNENSMGHNKALFSDPGGLQWSMFFFAFVFLLVAVDPPLLDSENFFVDFFCCRFDLPRYPWDLSHISPGHFSKFFGLAWIWSHMPLDSFDRVPPMLCWKWEMLRLCAFSWDLRRITGQITRHFPVLFFRFCGGVGFFYGFLVDFSRNFPGNFPGDSRAFPGFI